MIAAYPNGDTQTSCARVGKSGRVFRPCIKGLPIGLAMWFYICRHVRIALSAAAHPKRKASPSAKLVCSFTTYHPSICTIFPLVRPLEQAFRLKYVVAVGGPPPAGTIGHMGHQKPVDKNGRPWVAAWRKASCRCEQLGWSSLPLRMPFNVLVWPYVQGRIFHRWCKTSGLPSICVTRRSMS